MKKYKICVLTPGAYPVPATQGGAVENLVEMMAQNFPRYDGGCSLDIISVYTAQAQSIALQYDGVDFRFIRFSKLSKSVYRFIKKAVRKVFGFIPLMLDPYFSRALKIIRKEKYDAVIIENCIEFAPALKRHCKSKVIFHLHNDFSNFDVDFAPVVTGNSDMVMTVSDYVSSNVRKKAVKDIPVVTVRNVIDTSRFANCDGDAEALREKLGFAPDDIVFLFAGRIIPEKGIHMLVEALSKTKNNRIKLIAAGGSAYSDSEKTPFEMQLMQDVEKYGLGDRVVFTGYVNYSELPLYYKAADAAAFPSMWEEAAGLVLLEAQSAGKPVIAAKSGGMPEYVCADSAFVFERDGEFSSNIAQAMDRIAEDAVLREKMSAAGREFVKKFDKSCYCSAVLDPVVEFLSHN